MRWSIIRLIWFRELRDQLRDRRTVFMVVVLPLLLYPILGAGVMRFALGFGKAPGVVGVVGLDNLPPTSRAEAPPAPAQAAAWLAAVPVNFGNGIDLVAGAAALDYAAARPRGTGYPPLVTTAEGGLRFSAQLFEAPQEADALVVRPIAAPAGSGDDWLSRIDRTPLEAKQVDLLVVVPPGFRDHIERGDPPALTVLARAGDDRSRLVNLRASGALARWKQRVREVRLLRRGLPASFGEPFVLDNPGRAGPGAAKPAEGLFEMFVRVFPFMLVMWSLAGALYPAVDLCAGEKERGTMETLLITPAGREEIVYGKFLTIWVFSAATTLLNLVSMGLSTLQLGGVLPGDVLRPGPLLWCAALILPMSAFFSALCLAVGAYARSSKEGQYYLMPLFLLSMPLIFLTLAPGVELNAFYGMVPVTGVALLLQRLMTAPSASQVPWRYFAPVLAPVVVYSWLALRWAVEQFQREDVLFREAERLDVLLWLRRLFRDKEAAPTTAMAFICFALVMALRWAALGLVPALARVESSGAGLLLFMAAPPLLMAVLFTRRPAEALALRRPSLRSVAGAAALAVLLLLPLLEMTRFVLDQFPEIRETLHRRHPIAQALDQARGPGAGASALQVTGIYLLVFALLPAVCEELAFRGFILTGLRRRFGPGAAVVISSFLFAAAHLSVIQLLPSFFLGMVLGMIAVRCGSVLPGMAAQLVYNGLLVGLAMANPSAGVPDLLTTAVVRFALESLSVVLAGLVLWRLLRRVPDVVAAPLREGAAVS